MSRDLNDVREGATNVWEKSVPLPLQSPTPTAAPAAKLLRHKSASYPYFHSSPRSFALISNIIQISGRGQRSSN